MGLVMEKICTTVSRDMGLLFSRSAKPYAPKYTSLSFWYTSADTPTIFWLSTNDLSAASMACGSITSGCGGGAGSAGAVAGLAAGLAVAAAAAAAAAAAGCTARNPRAPITPATRNFV